MTPTIGDLSSLHPLSVKIIWKTSLKWPWETLFKFLMQREKYHFLVLWAFLKINSQDTSLQELSVSITFNIDNGGNFVCKTFYYLRRIPKIMSPHWFKIRWVSEYNHVSNLSVPFRSSIFTYDIFQFVIPLSSSKNWTRFIFQSSSSLMTKIGFLISLSTKDTIENCFWRRIFPFLWKSFPHVVFWKYYILAFKMSGHNDTSVDLSITLVTESYVSRDITPGSKQMVLITQK